MQTDGDLVIYQDYLTEIWSTGTSGLGTAPYMLSVETTDYTCESCLGVYADAYNTLVVLDSDNETIWSSDSVISFTSIELVKAVMQDDGNLVFFEEGDNFVYNNFFYQQSDIASGNVWRSRMYKVRFEYPNFLSTQLQLLPNFLLFFQNAAQQSKWYGTWTMMINFFQILVTYTEATNFLQAVLALKAMRWTARGSMNLSLSAKMTPMSVHSK